MAHFSLKGAFWRILVLLDALECMSSTASATESKSTLKTWTLLSQTSRFLALFEQVEVVQEEVRTCRLDVSTTWCWC